ncbi:MAG TPA: hypothetical protein VFL94_07740 [Actinomycetales bacterium]|nr:hypothetical protein [Actinomycetales bacterium]
MSTTRPAGTSPDSPALARSADGPLTRRLVDDAAVFPPGNAPLPQAVEQHRAHRSSWYAPAVGPLLVRLSDAPGLHELLVRGEGLAVGLVCPPDASAGDVARAVDLVQQDDRAVVTALEQLVGDRARAQGLSGVARGAAAVAWCEVPAGSTADGSVGRRLDDVTAAGGRAKYRTGGVLPQAFPDERQVARFLLGCVERRLPFKLTAGLHHAVRHTAVGAGDGGEDLEQHGVANVMTAVAAGLDGAPEADVAALLRDRDPARVAARLAALDDEVVCRVRELFVSFGCCGVTDPLTDLVTLGLLRRGDLDRPTAKETS